MSSLSFDDQPKTPTRSYQLQADSPVASTPRSTQSPAVLASNPPPASRPYQGYNAQAQHRQQQQPYAPPAYAPQYPAVRQPSAISQTVRQQSAQTSDTFCCCDVLTAVQVFATIVLVLYFTCTSFYVYVYYTDSSYNYNGRYVYPASSFLTLIMILDVVNACCVQRSCWFCFSAVIWGTVAGIKIGYLLVATFLLGFSSLASARLVLLFVWLFMAPDIAFLITYTIVLCKASDAAKQHLDGSVMHSQPQYAPQSPMNSQYANRPQQYRA